MDAERVGLVVQLPLDEPPESEEIVDRARQLERPGGTETVDLAGRLEEPREERVVEVGDGDGEALIAIAISVNVSHLHREPSFLHLHPLLHDLLHGAPEEFNLVGLGVSR